MGNSKGLIAYFSRKGNNYVGSKIVNLAVGNTEVVARKIRDKTGSDIFKIQTVNTYPEDYTEATEVAREELRQDARPELSGHLVDMSSYDVIYLGYPNWWGTMPMAVLTFLESYDLSGKRIAPFCTHEGSGMGRSEQDLKEHCPNAKVMSGLAIRGGSASKADREVETWLKELDLVP
jgi:flavodoxin